MDSLRLPRAVNAADDKRGSAVPHGNTALDPIGNKVLFEKAQYILNPRKPPHQIQIKNIRKTNEGYYRVNFTDSQVITNGQPQKDTALLDLNFPFSVEDMGSLIKRCRNEPGVELFLSFGPGSSDYPKKNDLDAKEDKRAFFVVDEAFGRVWNTQEEASQRRHHVKTSDLKNMPERTFLFNKYTEEAKGAFDVIQAVNVISEPPTSPTIGRVGIFIELLAPGGKWLMAEIYSPDASPLSHGKSVAVKLGGTVDAPFH